MNNLRTTRASSFVKRVLIADDDSWWVQSVEAVVRSFLPDTEVRSVCDGGVVASIVAEDYLPDLWIVEDFFWATDGASATHLLNSFADFVDSQLVIVLIVSNDCSLMRKAQTALAPKRFSNQRLKVWECDRFEFARDTQDLISQVIAEAMYSLPKGDRLRRASKKRKVKANEQLELV